MSKSMVWRATLFCACFLVGGGPAVRPPFVAAQVVPQQVLPPEEEEGAEEPIPVEPVPDERIAERLTSVFSVIEEFDDIQIEVEEGVVRLFGTTPGAESRQAAEALAARFEGVLFVDNDIEAATDIEERITPAVERVQRYWDSMVRTLPVAAVALLVFLVFLLLARVVGRWEAPYRLAGVNPLIQSLVRRVLRMVVVLVGLVLALDVLGITALVGAVLGTAGIVGIALGFAFQDIVENYLAGILLSIRRPFSVNDHVRIEEHEGRIIRLTARDLVLMTLDGNHVRIPNATVFKSPMVNFTRNPLRLFEVPVGIGLDEDLARAIEIGVTRLRTVTGVVHQPAPFARVMQLEGSTVTVHYFGWVDQRTWNYYTVKSEAVRMLKAALDQAGVAMPEPSYRVLLRRIADTDGSEDVAREAREEAGPVPGGESGDPVSDQVREDLATSDEENLLEG